MLESSERVGESQEAAVEWRRLTDDLWAGRCGGRSVGTIEGGHRYAWIDADGRLHGRWDTLHEAQEAVRTGAPVAAPRWYERPWSGLLGWAVLASGAVALWEAASITLP